MVNWKQQNVIPDGIKWYKWYQVKPNGKIKIQKYIPNIFRSVYIFLKKSTKSRPSKSDARVLKNLQYWLTFIDGECFRTTFP